MDTTEIKFDLKENGLKWDATKLQENLAKRSALKITPAEYRLMCRNEELPLEAGTDFFCEGYLQTGPIMLPKEYAFDFLTFCVRNPRGLWVTEILEPGVPYTKIQAPDADIRTDINSYRIYEYGKVIDRPRNILKYWRDDLVTFFLNCSLGFEGVLRQNNIEFRTMGAFITNIPAMPAGRFSCDGMWVTCRVFKTTHDAIRAIEITSRLPISHGTPIHIGDPARIGIKDILKPDIWCSPTPSEPPKSDEIIIFWHCGLTAEAAMINAKLPFAIMLYPGAEFIGDHLTEEFAYTEEVGTHLVNL